LLLAATVRTKFIFRRRLQRHRRGFQHRGQGMARRGLLGFLPKIGRIFLAVIDRSLCVGEGWRNLCVIL
jgi:hypothetical protein